MKLEKAVVEGYRSIRQQMEGLHRAKCHGRAWA